MWLDSTSSSPSILSLRTKLIMSTAKGRRLQRMMRNWKLTIMCGLMTILVLRGTIGAGKFGTPAQDFEELSMHLKSATIGMHHGLQRRVRLAQVEEKKEGPGKRLLLLRKQDEAHKIRRIHKPYRLGPVITDWDEQRQQWKAQNPNVSMTTSIGGKPRMLLVTASSQPTTAAAAACQTSMGDHLLLMSIKNKIDYCRLHSIEIFYNVAQFEPEMAHSWAKLLLIRKLMLEHPQAEWIWWMDSEAMVTDMSFQVPVEKYQNHNLVMQGSFDNNDDDKSWDTGLHTESFLIRNCQWSLNFLDAWAGGRPIIGSSSSIRNKGGGELLTKKTLKGQQPKFEADDQSALVYLLTTRTQEWTDKVFLENSDFLNGFNWAISVDEGMMEHSHPGLGDHRWPFVTSFVGCFKPCSKVQVTDYSSSDKCAMQMERVFNIGDNQILGIYGYKHVSLMSKKVEKVRNDTADPLHLEAELMQKLDSSNAPAEEDTTIKPQS
ncbi:unnamed protein product [Sphagnum balticum]